MRSTGWSCMHQKFWNHVSDSHGKKPRLYSASPRSRPHSTSRHRPLKEQCEQDGCTEALMAGIIILDWNWFKFPLKKKKQSSLDACVLACSSHGPACAQGFFARTNQWPVNRLDDKLFSMCGSQPTWKSLHTVIAVGALQKYIEKIKKIIQI